MRIKIITAALFSLFFNLAMGQHTKIVELKPIHRQNGRYYYDFKRVDGGAYGLQIPLLSLDDEEINTHYKNFKSLRILEGAISFVPLIYFFSVISDHYIDQKTFWTIWGASLAGVIVVEIGAKSHLRKGIDRYNRLILQPSGKSMGLSLTYKF